MPRWLANTWGEDCCATALTSESEAAPSPAVVEGKEFETVAIMLATDWTTLTQAICRNYETGDGIRSYWIKTSSSLTDNGSDHRQTVDASIVERIWVRETSP